MAGGTTIMVSSTCYDLKQIRADLHECITNTLGHTALLSEYGTFPVDPDLTTVANCTKQVQDIADIFVLVVGGRYGSTDNDSDKSITNLEYVTAKNKGIPIYAFIDGKILSYMDVWVKNKNGDFSDQVDSTRVFEFIEEVRNNDKVWTHEFDTAQDIIDNIKIQLSYLLKSAVTFKSSILKSPISDVLNTLDPRSVKLILDKPIAWQSRLAFSILQSEIDSREARIEQYKAGISYGRSETVTEERFIEWTQTRLHEISLIARNISKLMNEYANPALSDIEEDEAAKRLIWVTRAVVNQLDQALDWANVVRGAYADDPYGAIVDAMALFPDDLIHKMCKYPGDSLRKIEETIMNTSGDEPITLNFTLEITISNMDEFEKQLSNIS